MDIKTSVVSLDLPKVRDPVRVTASERPIPVIVCCVWHGTKYSFEYVRNLHSAVYRHLPRNLIREFRVLTDRQLGDAEFNTMLHEDMNPVTLQSNLKTWWAKLELFRPDQFGMWDRVLYLDLDVVVKRRLTPLITVKDSFCMIENFGPNRPQSAHNSSMMLWTPDSRTLQIWNAAPSNLTEKLHGDQCWIWRVMDGNIANWEREDIASYKYHARRGERKGAAVIVFHGEPKPEATEYAGEWRKNNL